MSRFISAVPRLLRDGGTDSPRLPNRRDWWSEECADIELLGVAPQSHAPLPAVATVVVDSTEPGAGRDAPPPASSDDENTQPLTNAVETAAPAAADGAADFLDSLILPLLDPIITSTPSAHAPRRRRRVDADADWTPRRSSRLAAKSVYRDPEPERQAKKIMLGKWKDVPTNAVPDLALDEEFQKAFAAASLSARKQAMAVMFPRAGARRPNAAGGGQ